MAAKTSTKRSAKNSKAKDGTTKPSTKKSVSAEPQAAKATPTKRKAKVEGGKKLSAIDAAAKVLAESKASMNAKEMIDAMATKGYWASPGGKTPHATLYSAILREINVKGKESRFQKTERGKFTVRG